MNVFVLPGDFLLLSCTVNFNFKHVSNSARLDIKRKLGLVLNTVFDSARIDKLGKTVG